MIKLKHLLNEVLENNSIQNVVDKVYPQIVNDLGGQIKPVEIHTNIWDRLGAVGVEDLKREQGNPDAQYDPYDNIIYLYSEKTNTEEDIIKSLFMNILIPFKIKKNLKNYTIRDLNTVIILMS